MTIVLDGKTLAQKISEQVTKDVSKLKAEHNITPCLAVVLVGEDPASKIYVSRKKRQAVATGMLSKEITLPETTSKKQLLKEISLLNADPNVHGILVQLPLPKHIDTAQIIEAIDPRKDVDGFHPVNSGRLFSGVNSALVPCTPRGCVTLVKNHRGQDLTGLLAIVIGCSNIVGKPMAQLLLQEKATVIMAHSKTQDLPTLCRKADILVVAVGVPGLVKADWVKEGATVIDVGINRINNPEGGSCIVGDVDYVGVSSVAGAITPVPGGVGPMTIVSLLQNTYAAAVNQIYG
ncbi:bifunctional 5,10-methylenetetrahydrofolate dehydrogenase/5,10-methenyltetrahydrofolate cyclohydrolase [Kordiimonas pumila]|uniref:Bifunctional protein FolD n=1 Tax=Kordiimonas pumila TaxID=2161677 RepID=A0ABV7D8N5_9PROT|nr:bifunctional methylenetetrahydrofolate dehydrogenase/methenyltetrahydrofolate cyclohydrolase FolD [Kordiimonas pumila]